MTAIRVNVPPDGTPEEEAQLGVDIAAAYAESTGSHEVSVEVQRPEEVDDRTVAAGATSRWSS